MAVAALLTHGADVNAKANSGCGCRSLFSATVGAGSAAVSNRDGIDAHTHRTETQPHAPAHTRSHSELFLARTHKQANHIELAMSSTHAHTRTHTHTHAHAHTHPCGGMHLIPHTRRCAQRSATAALTARIAVKHTLARTLGRFK